MATKIKNKRQKKTLQVWADECGKELSYTKVIVICKIRNCNTAIDFANQTKSGANQKVVELFPNAKILRTIAFSAMISF